MSRLESMPTLPDDMRFWSWNTVSNQEPPVRAEPDAPVTTIMRPPICAASSTSLARVARMVAGGFPRMLVVVDSQHHPLGIVTPAHVLDAVAAHDRDELPHLTALDAATSGGAFLLTGSTIECAARRFALEDREVLVVVDASGRTAGIVLATDVLAASHLSEADASTGQ